MAIHVNNIDKTFGDFVALDDVSVEIPDGALTALLGPSGGGKSTLLRVIAGLESPDRGTVQINGVDSTALPPQRRNVGFVFQHYAAFKHMTVARNVAFGLEIRKRPKDEIERRVRELLELVHLEAFGDRLPSQLSGGQRQRMALARALAVQPNVLLLDEPFGALDEMTRHALQVDLGALWRRLGMTVVFVTHSVFEAAFLAGRAAVLGGRPATVAATLDVPLPRVRDESVRMSPAYGDAVRALHACVRADAGDARSAPGDG
jgi:sulfate transport system ATP-binding protein